MLTMTHPDVGTAACASLDQFELVWEPKGWRLVTDDGELVPAATGGVPTAHIVPTPVTAAETIAAATTIDAEPDPVESTSTVDLTRPTNDTDGAAVDNPESEED